MRSLVFFLISMLSLSASSQSVLFQEDFTSGIPSTWAMVNSDNLVPASTLFTFSDAWIFVETTTDTCAASTSYYTPSGQSADYLITPKLSLDTYSKFVWSTRSYDASFPDSYVVLISSTDSLIGSFTDTLLTVLDESNYWEKHSVQLDLEGYANQDVYITIKNITDDGYILFLDDVKLLGSNNASVSEQSNLNYSVYPNPCQDQITISNFKQGDLVSVYSMDGNLLLNSFENVIDLTRLSSGTYLLKITSTNGVFSSPFIKQ